MYGGKLVLVETVGMCPQRFCNFHTLSVVAYFVGTRSDLLSRPAIGRTTSCHALTIGDTLE